MATVSPATAPIPASKESYRPDLDGIRAFCILFTVAHHVPSVPDWLNGTIGVDVFFGLSGWLITSLLIRERTEAGEVNLTGFYIRRVFRILPLYYLTVIAYSAATHVGTVLPSLDYGVSNGPAAFYEALPYLLTLCVEYRPSGVGEVFGHAWTIGIEEKFYIFWPVLLVLFGRNRLALLAASLVVVAVLSIAWGASGFLIRGYIGLMFGAGLAVMSYSSDRMLTLVSRPIAGPALGTMALFYGASLVFPHPWIWNVTVSLAGTVMIASLWFTKGQWVSRLLAFGWLPWLGRLTYAIYLLQSLCINVAEVMLKLAGIRSTFAVSFALSYVLCVFAAWVAHVAIERPMIRKGKALSLRVRKSPGPRLARQG